MDDLLLIVNDRRLLFLQNVERSGYDADIEDEGEEDEAPESPEPFTYPDLMDLDDGWMDDGGGDIDLTVERVTEPSASLQDLVDLHNRLLLASSHSPLVHTPTPSPSVQPIPTSPSPIQPTPLNSLPAQLVFTEMPSHESSVPSDSSENLYMWHDGDWQVVK